MKKLRVLYLKSTSYSREQEIIDKSVLSFLSKISDQLFQFNINRPFYELKKIIKRLNLKIFFFIFIFVLKSLFYIPKEIICLGLIRSIDHRRNRNALIDDFERKTGNIFKPMTLSFFILNSLKLTFFMSFIELFISLNNIDAVFMDQLDGIPYSSVANYCKRKNILLGNYSKFLRNILIIIRKGIIYERLPLPVDLKGISKIKNESLDKLVLEISKDHEKGQDVVLNTHIKNFTLKDNSLIISKYLKSKKKNVIVMLHTYTDQSRFRTEGCWFANYQEWTIETIKICSQNNNVNWIFKAHPHEHKYPISPASTNFLIDMIKSSGFDYIDYSNQFLHKDVSRIASCIVTCHGNCKLEYPAMYGIPTISCDGEYIPYNSKSLPHTALNYEEYRHLLLNAHKLALNDSQIEFAKKMLIFLRRYSGADVNKNQDLFIHKDYKGENVYRNF